MADFANIILKAGAEPAFVLAEAGITSENGYGYRDNDDGSHTIVVRTEDLERVAQIAGDYDAIYLDKVLKPAAVDRLRELRKVNMAWMPLGDRRIDLDDVTLARMHQASGLLDKAPDLAEIAWEVTPGTFATWPREQMQQIAVAAGLHVQACYRHQRDQTVAVRAAATADDLAKIDLEAGWPDQ